MGDLQPPAHVAETLDSLIARRVADLTAYQNARYAKDYAGFVAKVRAAEQAALPGEERLSRAVATEIQQASGRGEEFAPATSWGPDLPYYDAHRVAGPGRGVVSAGRTGRDWATLIAGATRAGMPAEIFRLGGERLSAPPGVVVHHGQDEGDFPYPRLLPALARARRHR